MVYAIGKYLRGFIHKTSKNINHVHKDSNDLLSVIIVLGTDAHGGSKIFHYGMTRNEIGKGAHVLNYSHVRCVGGDSDKNVHEGSIWN